MGVNAARKAKSPSPVLLGAGTVNARCQCVQTLRRLCKTLFSPLGLAAGHVSAGPDLLIHLSGLSVNLSYPTYVSGDLTCCLTLAAISGPALLTLLRRCGTAPCSVTPSWLAFPLREALLWLFPNIPPLTGSHSNPLLKPKKAALEDGCRNYLAMYKNNYCTSKVHF